MKVLQILFLGLFFFSIHGSITAQERLISRADKDYKEYAFIDARNSYLKALDSGYESQDLYERIADSYYFNSELSNAHDWYEKLYNKYGKAIKPEHLFRYNLTLRHLKRYDEADKILNELASVSGENEQRISNYTNEQNYLDLIAMQANSFNVANLGSINGTGSDFGPSFYDEDKLIFSAPRKSAISNYLHEWNEAEFLDFYVTQRVEDSWEVEGLALFNSTINTKFHESTPVFTNDGNTMYFTRNNYTGKKRRKSKEGTTLLKLYKSEKKGSGWTQAEELPFNSDEYSVAHPALSPDNKKLYFASDMPGTLGFSDIFSVDILDDGTYSEPVNLGSVVNTEARETFPFISDKGDLYFSSEGHIGLGGLDVFVSKPSYASGEEVSFTQPVNLGEPLNTSSDDFAFIIGNDDKTGYFSSNRSGGMGSDDIYAFTKVKNLITECKQYLKGQVTDEETQEIIPNATVILFNADMTELERTVSDSNGNYDLGVDCDTNYVVRALKDGYDPSEKPFASDGRYEYSHDLPLSLRMKPIAKVAEAELGQDLGKILQLNPIYFDLDKSFIRPDAEIELQKVIEAMREYPNLDIDVRSHTDSRSSKQYNEDLSTRRVNSTIDYIVNVGGISASRLTGRGYGEYQLVNGCSDGVKCSEEEHQLNRRSEFIIVKM